MNNQDATTKGPIQVIGGIAGAIALVKKYYAPTMATIALVIWLVSYIGGKATTPPPPIPVWPAGHYVSDGVTLKVAPTDAK